MKKTLRQRRLLVICGPTATGKTKLAIRLAKFFSKQGAELISADSRQVYKGMDIGTGKDKPKDTIIWGYDLVEPTADFSVSHYQKYAREKIKQIWNENHLPILVGGTGFYIRAVVDGIGTIYVPPNESLRQNLSGKSAFTLFNMLAKLDPQKAISMNISDKNNPRRLIRAIEIASAVDPKEEELEEDEFVEDVLFIGLSVENKILKKNIIKRVNERIEGGMEEEVQSLVRKGVEWTSQALNSLGYKYWEKYFRGEYNLEELKEKWVNDEYHYALRQMTWFKKDERIVWIDLSLKGWEENVEKLVENWYYQNYDAKKS